MKIRNGQAAIHLNDGFFQANLKSAFSWGSRRADYKRAKTSIDFYYESIYERLLFLGRNNEIVYNARILKHLNHKEEK